MTEPDAEWKRALSALRAGALLVWLGLFSFYVKVWIEPHDTSGALERWAQQVVDGRSVAPYQYRFLAPEVLIGMHDHLGVPVGRAQIVLDGALLALGAVGFDRLFRQLQLTEWVLPAAGYGAFLGLGILWWGKFETITAFAALTWACVALLDRRHRAVLILAVPVLVMSRTDLVAALGVAFLASWWLDRRRRDDLAIGLALGVAAVMATIAFTRIWPDAHYGEQGLVQLAHNLRPAVWLTALAFLGPVLLPYLVCRPGSRARAALDGRRTVIAGCAALVIAELVFTGLVGRIEEVRMFFPLAAPLAVLGAIGWQAALASRPTTAPAGVAAIAGPDRVRAEPSPAPS